ncbi:MAG TPA: hypothetical protein VIN08_14075 [Ohtaekwangia sp.]|uniref:hypothetical protein n=1 Tax=Ohtaekwangia sp. TaxID=2066019 RepID=UPI002F91EE59
MPERVEKICIECGTTIQGRVDKKFCSDHCRSSHNNKRIGTDTRYIRNINNILRRNRRILSDLNPEGKSKVSRDKLADRGFNFNFFTGTFRTNEGSQYFCCYDQGYLPLDNECLLLEIPGGLYL